MGVLRTAATVVICLWLMLPGTSTFALCIDHHGGVALQVAVGDACAGPGQDGAGRSTERPSQMAAPDVHCCGDCTDVVLRGAGDAVPSSDSSTKRTRERAVDEIAEEASLCTCDHLSAVVSGGKQRDESPPELHPSTGFTVLRL